MCGLCGVLGGRDHWTDASSNRAAFQGRPERTRQGERQRRTRLVNAILNHYGLSLGDWAGTNYVLRSHTGRTALVENLTELWAAAEGLSGRSCDPLDGSLLAALARVDPV